jgi:hypothetical protein
MTPEQERAIRERFATGYSPTGGSWLASCYAATADVAILLAALDAERAENARLRAALGQCLRCAGTGEHTEQRGPCRVSDTCPECGGTGGAP